MRFPTKLRGLSDALFFFCAVQLAYGGERPNIVIVMTDDQGYGDLSCHGNPVLQTPNLDALAEQSVRLTDFHVAPMCTPTRGQLLTGIDALRNRAMNVSSGRTLLKRGLPTMADLFAAAGYRTGIFGKWHLGDNYPYRPQDRGFQESLTFPSSHINSLPDYWENDYYDDVYVRNGERTRVEGYCTDLFFDEAIEWIAAGQDEGQPFFAYVPLNAPHGPLFVPDAYREAALASLDAKADELPKFSPNHRDQLARFLGMIANIDENVGKLLAFLDDSNLADDTIVIFLTDNGSTMGPSYYNAGMKGGKTTLWEGGHRVPCFIRWPKGKLGSPRDVDELIQVQDLLPTLLELCGVAPDDAPRMDGMSLAPLLRGHQDELPDRMLVINYSRMPPSSNDQPASIPQKDGGAVLWKKWRLLRGEQLYDLAADPGQSTDVSDQHPEIFARMRAHQDQWWNDLGPVVTAIERVVVGHPRDNPTTLSACEWLDVFADQQNQVRQGIRRNGTWHLEAHHAGSYEFQLRRWPSESELALDEGTPPTKVVDGVYGPGEALPIRAARLEVGQQQFERATEPGDESVSFEVDLPAGQFELRATFLDEAGEQICGAYYVEAKALAKSTASDR